MRKLYGIDLDGTLCKEVCWTAEDCLLATPNIELIKKVNRLFESDFVIIYTARARNLTEVSMDWLERHGVKYHAYQCRDRKIPLDVYVDADAVHPDDL